MENTLQFVSTNFDEQLYISATINFLEWHYLLPYFGGNNHLKLKMVFLYLKQLKYFRNHAFDINCGVVLFL